MGHPQKGSETWASTIERAVVSWVRLQVEAAGVFPGGVLFLACVVHQELLDEQRRVYDAVQPLMVDPWPYFRPGRWTPHITCGMGCTAEQISDALAVLLKHLPIEGCLDSGGVEDGTTGESWLAPTDRRAPRSTVLTDPWPP
jgi:hypothetical protein